ncbi:MAG: hypothetical protein HOG05_02450 [Bacteroidetes bacterium]|nr:hypothetical protein [Bacteroidota bacterium]
MNYKFLIKQGPTFQGWNSFFGVFIMLIGGILISNVFADMGFVSVIRKVSGILVFAIGLQLFLFIQGVILDSKSKRLKIYYFLFFRLGYWIDISTFDCFEIEKYESAETRGVVTAFATVRTKYYDLYLTKTGHSDRILLKSCASIEYAEALRDEIEAYLEMKG